MSDTDNLISKALLARIEEKKKILDERRPLPEEAVRNLREEIRLQHTFHSNAIEGNTLTLQETKLVLEEGITVGGKPLKDCLEARNTAKAFDLIEEMVNGRQDITHETIQLVHEDLTKGILETPGKYRTQNVRITGAIKLPPDFSKIIRAMDELIDGVARRKTHPIETAAFFHHKFVEIHPFLDGNGRTARLLTNLYLMRKHYPPVVLRKEDRAKYYKCLKEADIGNLKPFADFIAKAVDEAITHYLSIFGGEDGLISLKELAKSTRYTQEYLSLRARQGRLSSVKIGYIWYSTRYSLRRYIEQHKKQTGLRKV